MALTIMAAFEIRLSPDEAQYWSWSQALDWGYFSKPPAIAWQIWLTTSVFGNNEFGVRFGAVVISFLISLSVFHLGQFCRLPERVCFWGALLMAFSPLGVFLTFAATTDGGMMLFLILAIAEVAKGIEEQKGPNYTLAGVWLFLAALYKWTAYLFWPITLLMILFTPKLRKLSLLTGLAISLLALLPSVYWNFSHDFATFKHVGRTLYDSSCPKVGNFIDFFFSQIGILSPIFFFLMVASYFYIKRPTFLYLGLFPFVILFYLVTALSKKIQPNWGLFLYPPGLLLAAWVAIEKIKNGRLWLHLGLWLAILGTLGAISIPAIQRYNVFADYQVSYKANPVRQNVGWEKIAPVLKQAGYNPQQSFLFADKYQTVSLLNFYGPDRQAAYFFNLNKDRKNHFSYTEKMEVSRAGQTGFFVLIENAPISHLSWYEQYYPEKLAPYFRQVTHVGSFPLFLCYEKPVKHAIIFKCENYSGLSPKDPELY